MSFAKDLGIYAALGAIAFATGCAAKPVDKCADHYDWANGNKMVYHSAIIAHYDSQGNVTAALSVEYCADPHIDINLIHNDAMIELFSNGVVDASDVDILTVNGQAFPLQNTSPISPQGNGLKDPAPVARVSYIQSE
jgi:hypothetical protein